MMSFIRKFLKRFYAIYSHPTTKRRWFLTMKRAFLWLFMWKIIRMEKMVFPFLENSQLIARTGTIGCAGAYICSLFEYEEMMFLMKKLLRKSFMILDSFP
jgi:hypothetical protein